MTMQELEIIFCLYRRLLLREPDVVGLHALMSHFQSPAERFDDLITQFLESPEFKSKIHIFTRKYGGDLRFTNDHSQHGEFAEIMKIFLDRGAHVKLVVDVGANGKERSNSYDLLEHFGWRGILVEANPALYPAIDKDFSGLDYELVKTAVSDTTGRGLLALGVNSDISSLESTNTAQWWPISGNVEVVISRLPDILDERGVPHYFDLLSLDIEGFDVRVLNDLVCNSAYRPEVVIVEATTETGDLRSIGVATDVVEAYRITATTKANLILQRT